MYALTTTAPSSALPQPPIEWAALVGLRLNAARVMWDALSHDDFTLARFAWLRANKLDVKLAGWSGYRTFHDDLLMPAELERAHLPGTSWPSDQVIAPCGLCTPPVLPQLAGLVLLSDQAVAS